MQISLISLTQFAKIQKEASPALNWDCPFVLPFWLAIWHDHFIDDCVPNILKLQKDSEVGAIAPLMINKQNAEFLGSESVLDFQDIIIGKENPDNFFISLLHHLKNLDIRILELGALKSDSAAMQALPKICKQMGYKILQVQTEPYFQMELPATFEEYLSMLKGKQRHEVRRKLRRLSEAGKIEFTVVKDEAALKETFPVFLNMFKDSRMDKAQFLSPSMTSYFKSLAMELARQKMLWLTFLSIDKNPCACTFSFEFNNTLYLYNNGYDPAYKKYSVGHLCKVFTIKHGIEQKIKCFNFLKGEERYKKHLGGKMHPLYRLTVHLDKGKGK
ncbi:MAG: GNAT family N-acetyltransferase [Desulfobacteraceae bacterium]|nr:GNAT family N-acetyltransferase [Desulfobacteraceae bacterium]